MKLRLRDLCEDSDKTQQELADFLNCRQQTYSRYENGVAQPSLETLAKIAIYFNVSTDYILNLTDDPTPPKRKKL